MSRLRYLFKFQWRKPVDVAITGDYAFHMTELLAGRVVYSFIGAGWVYVLAAAALLFIAFKL